MIRRKLKDVQNSLDIRKVPVQKVGIRNLRYPILVLDRRNASQNTVATINMFVDLPHKFKGTHMSRFIEIINHCRGRISVQQIGAILNAMIDKFESETAHIDIRFPYFIEKAAPVSGARSLMDYDCGFIAAMNATNKGNPLDLILEVAVPVTTLCPCSKEISKYGAHNQRSKVTIQVRTLKLVWLEDLIEIAESAASAPLYSLLKREDEKSVTEKAFENPRFAEDIVRSVAVKLRADRRVSWYQVETENFESIHNHNAYALVTGTRG
ncbi:MAG: GTP cyclohydrolase [Lentisphaerae bacterium RIFOXYA12_FULL_48_11]|nr:MAG: GTP cyclohydrolase [Lentisphaerae bacterium RIFOXYA12_FULL_48_11]